MSRWTWIFRMAWRDSRGSRARLGLYLSAMVLGVAALVAIRGFGDNFSATIDREARKLLGADLRIEAEEAFSDSTEALIDSLGGAQARRFSFASMSYFPKTGDTRLASVRAVDEGYPFYGSIQTRPAEAATRYHSGRQALVDGTLLQQFGAEVGDSVRIGRVTYQIAGEIQQIPSESSFTSSFSPRIYVPRSEVDTALFQRGSRVEHEVFFRFDGEGPDTEQLRSELEPYLERNDVDIDTVDEEAEDWREGIGNLYRFLSLVGFVALLLGSIGVASAVNVYIRRRIASIAVLRCLGADGASTFRIYLVQAAAIGLVGAVAGSLLGVVFQAFVPRLLSDFLPFAVDFFVSWVAIGIGLGVGVGVTFLCALWPLLDVRGISPLRALRSDVDPSTGGWADPARWVIGGAMAAAVTGFALLQAPEWEIGLGYAGGLIGVFAVLAGLARLLTWAVRRYFPSTWPYPWRQGLANLYRPNNQTSVLLLTLGMGTFLIATLFLSQRTLLEQIRVSGGENRPNLVLFDVQPDQLDGVTDIVRANGLPVLQQEPIVTTRLRSVQGRTIEEIRRDSTARTTWAHEREYRVTYRDRLTASETLVRGELADSVAGNPIRSGTAVPVSIEEEIARELGVGLGDTLAFDVQGVPVTTTVGSIRRVDWQRIGTNYFVVFPKGVLENAPQIHVVLSRSDDEAAAAKVQGEVVQRYPNVSAIDLSLILSTVQELFGKLSYVIRFMALFSILTGLIVLAAAVVVSRQQRAQESVLLKTLGAGRRTVLKIMTVEYLFLGLLAALTGIALAVAAAWALSIFVFEGPLVVAPLPLAVTAVAVTGLTIAIGLLNSRGVYKRPPLEVLREET
jgi:putative ABC transport system permease protein